MQLYKCLKAVGYGLGSSVTRGASPPGKECSLHRAARRCEQRALWPTSVGLELSKYQCVSLSLTNLLSVLLQILRKVSFVPWLKLSSFKWLKTLCAASLLRCP